MYKPKKRLKQKSFVFDSELTRIYEIYKQDEILFTSSLTSLN